jgi:hypothetical protein
MISRRTVLLMPAAAIAAAAPARAQKAWKTYRNARFGTSIDYPADRFHPLPPPANGDGLRFEARDGARFTVSAIRNIDDDTLAEVEKSYLADREAGETITYCDKGPDWFVLSGTRGGMIFYERHLLSHRNALINTFDISYPARLKSTYDPIVTRMSRSLRPGVGADGEKP